MTDLAKQASAKLRQFARSAYARLPGSAEAAFALRPYELHLELTNLCNAKCLFCPYTMQARPHEQMSQAVFEKAVAEFVAMGGGSVVLTPTVGDPLIHPRFVEWVRRLRSEPSIDRITITTNAILVQKIGAKAILDAGLSAINISLAGFDEDMYRRVYRSDMYPKVRDGIYALYEENARRAEPVPLFLCLRPDRPAAEVLAHPDLQPLLDYEPVIDIPQKYSRSGGQITELPPGMELEDIPSDAKVVPCAYTYSGAMVLSNGDVQICPCESSVNADALVIGNIETDSLLDIWRGERLRSLRASFTDGTLNANCAACDQYYSPVDFTARYSRRRARILRRRLAGHVIRHDLPLRDLWQVE